MIGSVIFRTLVASVLTLILVAIAIEGPLDTWDLVGSAIAAVLWWTLLTDWIESR